MRSLALLLAIIGVSAAASIPSMNGHKLQEAMMKEVLGSDSLGSAMGFDTLMGHQNDEPAPEAHADDEGAAERDARGTDDKANGHHPFPAMASMFPEMFAHDAPNGHNGHAQSDDSNPSANGNGQSSAANGNGNATPYSANGNGHAPASNGNGNGNSAPANGNGQSKPGNGNRSGGAAAASATSISRGSNSFSASQAQAFSFGGGSH